MFMAVIHHCEAAVTAIIITIIITILESFIKSTLPFEIIVSTALPVSIGKYNVVSTIITANKRLITVFNLYGLKRFKILFNVFLLFFI